jgi:hypothetical protein
MTGEKAWHSAYSVVIPFPNPFLKLVNVQLINDDFYVSLLSGYHLQEYLMIYGGPSFLAVA